MGKYPAWSFLAVFSLLAVKVLSDDLDLAAALGTPTSPTDPSTKPEAAAVTGGGDSDLSPDDKPPTKAPELVITAATATKAPVKVQPETANQEASDDLDLSDALDPKNEIGGKDKNKDKAEGTFSDDDLFDIGKGDGYSPDKGKGEGGATQDDSNYDTMAETGTIAGIVSAVAVALVGAVSSYISYQKKKLCFSIQQGLNEDVTKGENPEAVVSTEPQAQQTLLQSPKEETPNNENTL